MHSLVTSIFLYACESWTLTADLQIRIQAMEAGCENRAGKWTTRRPLDHHKETQTAVVWTCLPFIRSCQNHLARHLGRGKKTRQTRKRLEDNTRKWTGLEFVMSKRAVENREKRRKLVAKLYVVSQRPSWLRDR